MNITPSIDLVQKVNRSISGIKSAPRYDEYPEAIRDGMLPLALTFVGQGSTTAKELLAVSDRLFLIEVYTGSTAQGVWSRQRQTAGDLLTKFVKAWTERINTNEDHVLDYGTLITTPTNVPLNYGSTSGYRVEMNLGSPIEDTGVQSDMEWMPEEFYHGFVVAIPVKVRWGSGLL